MIFTLGPTRLTFPSELIPTMEPFPLEQLQERMRTVTLHEGGVFQINPCRPWLTFVLSDRKALLTQFAQQYPHISCEALASLIIELDFAAERIHALKSFIPLLTDSDNFDFVLESIMLHSV